MIRLAVRAPADGAEPVLAALLELAPAGLEEVEGDGWVEYAVYGAPGELPALAEGQALVGGVAVSVRGDEVVDDWAERWRRFHRPVLVGGRLRVRPPWEAPLSRPGVEEVVIDPGRAFGTGAHPTTEGCLALLLELREGVAGGLRPLGAEGAPAPSAARPGTRGPGRSLADLGCGSGVLAIAAARLGFRPVLAVDCDHAALEATDRNARANGVRLDLLERIDLRRAPPPRADVVVANLMRPLLLEMARRMDDRPRALVVSGLLDGEAEEGIAAFAPLAERRRVSVGGWTSALLAA